MFLKVSRYSQENTCIGVSLYKIAGLRSATLWKIDSGTGIFLGILLNFKKGFFIEYLEYFVVDAVVENVFVIQYSEKHYPMGSTIKKVF